jgi:hypothetical protein
MATDSGLDPRTIAAEDIDKMIPADVAKEILRAVASIEYGSIEVVIHENKVVQIECREKIRVSQSGSGRKASKS